MKDSVLRQTRALGVSLAASGVVAIIGGVATSRGLGAWYEALRKPAWNPPSWIFGPVWTLLYVLMAVAAYVVWRAGFALGAAGEVRRRANVALVVYAVHLAFNALWSWVFFAWQSPGWAVLEIGVLWVLILVTIALFARIRPMAGWILVPYAAWVTFAAFLNFTLWRLNAA
ncbi:MAG: putative TspO/MBR-related protein precursor [Phycisphaerae bacterium]|nr:MAG: putative TspO/MBR-related protein precursor [Phycisphaerae bacterium]